MSQHLLPSFKRKADVVTAPSLGEVSTVTFHPLDNYGRKIQYMPKKPTKWGFKAFILADSRTGYTYIRRLYTGK